MENELQILNNIEKNKNATQRDIAMSTGMSLGNVNMLIKRLVRKGLVKIERLNPRNIRYILTPQGMKEQAEATYNYIRISYRYIGDINRKIDMLMENELNNAGNLVVLFGDKDEIYEMLEERLRQRNKKFVFVKTINDIIQGNQNEPVYKNLDGKRTVVWHPNYREKLIEIGLEYIYLLDII